MTLISHEPDEMPGPRCRALVCPALALARAAFRRLPTRWSSEGLCSKDTPRCAVSSPFPLVTHEDDEAEWWTVEQALEAVRSDGEREADARAAAEAGPELETAGVVRGGRRQRAPDHVRARVWVLCGSRFG
eukprot:TRINITY_DN1581_c0_g2_i6.p3 TRINITY_DN1581_c0_g2~~TRINITY_DN1581_c0_g2_i6.p3  ORF type:complete len:131 (-),score=20.29 TRINITY_DN1581_c0_g2_i6:1503-1895(-)